MPHAEEIEAHVLEVQRQIGGRDAEPSGRVRVSMPPSFAQGLFIPALAAFTKRHPEIEIDVLATNRISDLTRLEADVSIRITNTVDEDNVIGRRLTGYVLAAFASPAYVEAHPGLRETQGAGAHWIGFSASTAWIAGTPLPKAKARHRLPEVHMQLEAAEQGLGMAWVPGAFGDGYPGVIRVPGLPTAQGMSLWLLLHGDLRRTARVRAFVDFLADWMRAQRATFAA